MPLRKLRGFYFCAQLVHLKIEQLYQIFLQHPQVQTDSRKVKVGELFFALKGPSFNGNDFALNALEQGAAYAIVDEPVSPSDPRVLLVPDVLTALQQLAHHHRMQFQIPVIAITGSNGKTTTKELITAVLRQRFITYATEGNLNNHIGVPLTLLKIGADAQMAVVEMGANHQREIASYCTIAAPTHGIITNVGKAHIEGFGGEEGVRKGKGELFDFLRDEKGTIFCNADLGYLQEMAKGIGRQISYGSGNADFIGRPLHGDRFLSVAILNAGLETTIHTRLVGDYNFPNIMVAVAVGVHFGIDIDTVKAAIEAYEPDNSRSQLLTKGTNQIILDAYNANPTSMRAAIQNFAAMPGQAKLLWLGGMKEMGRDEQREHEDLLEFICQFSWKDVVLVGKEFEGLPHSFHWYATAAEAAAALKNQKPEHVQILIKGSRGSRMEQLLTALEP